MATNDPLASVMDILRGLRGLAETFTEPPQPGETPTDSSPSELAAIYQALADHEVRMRTMDKHIVSLQRALLLQAGGMGDKQPGDVHGDH